MLVLLGLLAGFGGLGSLPWFASVWGSSSRWPATYFLMISFCRFSNRWFIPGIDRLSAGTPGLHHRPEYPLAGGLPHLVDGTRRHPGAHCCAAPAANHGRSASERSAAAGAPGRIIRDGHHPDAALSPADALQPQLENICGWRWLPWERSCSISPTSCWPGTNSFIRSGTDGWRIWSYITWVSSH